MTVTDEAALDGAPLETNSEREYERNNTIIDPKGPLKRSAFRALVQDFTPMW